MTRPLFACIEAGGTKFVVGIASGPDAVLETIRIPTTTPAATISAAIDWLRSAQERHGVITAAGIASFGPAELDRKSASWGHITNTPKPYWANTDLAGTVAQALGVPIGFDTDVNSAGLAEARWGAGQGQQISVYVTIGTGIGGGAIIDGMPLHGLSHPEMGHMYVARHQNDLDFAGQCPFHGACLEGLASGPAIIARWDKSLSELPLDHPGHEIIAFYIAQMAITLQSVMEPGRIIFGGGVMSTPGLLNRARATANDLHNGYFVGNMNEVIVAPALGDKAGLLGALALAMDAID